MGFGEDLGCLVLFSDFEFVEVFEAEVEDVQAGSELRQEMSLMSYHPKWHDSSLERDRKGGQTPNDLLMPYRSLIMLTH